MFLIWQNCTYRIRAGEIPGREPRARYASFRRELPLSKRPMPSWLVFSFLQVGIRCEYPIFLNFGGMFSRVLASGGPKRCR